MTETSSRQSEQLGAVIRDYLDGHHALGPHEKITGVVLVVETAVMLHGRPVEGRHRMHPCKPMSASAELGLLQKATDDSRNQDRRCPFCD